MRNPFKKNTGALQLQHPIAILLVVIGAFLIGKLMSTSGIPLIAGLIFLPLIVIFINRVFYNPKIALFSIQLAAYFINGLPRYTGPIVPYGLIADGLFVLALVAIIFKHFYVGVNWKPMLKDVSLLAAVWMGWIFLEILNPEAVSFQAWFYTMRGIALYFFFGIPIVLLLMRNPKDLEIFFYIWGSMTILATLKGAMQLIIGLDPAEQRWMDAGAYQTHLLFGKLRVFSFMSDAGQFGASQAHALVMGGIIAYETKSLKKKLFFGIVALSGLYGMLISGTRGAIAIPALGFFTYLILTKNKKLIALGLIAGIAVYIFFAYTTILQSNYQVARLRTAFHPEQDASFQVRLDNQKILKNYLSTRPIGGGVGHAGVRAQKYVPNGFLANVATDSWYVLIWAENGAIGLLLHFFILFYIVIKGGYIIMFRIRDSELKARMMAILSGIMGILLANYGNAVMGQFPTSINVYYSMAFLFIATHYDKIILKERKMGKDPFILFNNLYKNKFIR
ncbi:MAG: O-antigen ligase domain-containing protein [Bacteroidetes bacterium]|nr:MAG: O-antigen ligase domain-containing protein [Bacteroidota bacterium]